MSKQVRFIFSFGSYIPLLKEKEEAILGPQEHQVNFEDNQSFLYTWSDYFISHEKDPAHEKALE